MRAHFLRRVALVAACVASISSVGAAARAQVPGSRLPECSGSDPAAARAAFEAGNGLMEQAAREARVDLEHARALAAEALARFDAQCEAGDEGALAERGAALMLMGHALRSAQSYDAYLVAHPLAELDARTRRRIEPNLQPGSVTIDVPEGATGFLLVDGLDFGALPRSSPVRLPFGEHEIEAHDEVGSVLANSVIELSPEAPATEIALALPVPIVAPPPPPVEVAPPPPPPVEPPPALTDYVPWYVTSSATLVVGLALGIGFIVAADERARTFNASCLMGPVIGCDAVLSERDTFLGVSGFGFALAGLAVVGLVTVIVLDAGQPRGARAALGVNLGGVSLSGEF